MHHLYLKLAWEKVIKLCKFKDTFCKRQTQYQRNNEKLKKTKIEKKTKS